VKQSPLGPAGLALAAVLTLCVVVPPEAHGSGAAAMAVFVGIAAVASAATAAGSAASRWLLAAVPVAIVAARTAIAPGEAVEPASWMLLAALAGIAAAHAADHEEPFAWALGALVALSGGRALFDAFRGSPLAEAGATDGFLVLALPAAAAWALGSSGRRRAFGFAAAALGAAGLVATRSLPAFGALACALGLVGMRRRVAPRALVVGATALGIALFGLAIAKPDAVFATSRDGDSGHLHAGGARAAFEIAREHPIAGVGPGGFAEAFPQYRRAGDDESRHAGDLPAQLAAEWGVPVGLTLSALFFWLFVGPAVRGGGDAWTLKTGLAVGLAAFALHNLAGFTAFLPSLLVCAAVCRGLLAPSVARDRATPALRAAWIAVSLVLALVAVGSGWAREALSGAHAAAAAGDPAVALRLALRASTLAPWDADPPLFAAGARMASGSSAAEALQDADRAVESAPARASARAVRARARSAAGDATGAYADLVEASRLYPLRTEYASQRDALAAALRSTGQAVPR
jgi:hypothetical protein